MDVLKLFTVFIIAAWGLSANAQNLITAVNEHHLRSSPAIVDEPYVPEHYEITKAQDRRQLMDYLKTFNAGGADYNQAKIKHLYNLANLFTRLRLYPLAMKCFFKTMQIRQAMADSLSAGNLIVNSIDDSVVNRQLLLLNHNGNKEIKSKPISYQQISSTFNDGKTAIAYAMIFHVKQPARGKRKIFVLANTGHTFITLIKYNSDSTYAAASFGFYPQKNNLLSATPLAPATSSTFKNDAEHQWDEVVGKFVSRRRFDKILALIKQYNNVTYHLSNNNCTDFGLKAASLAGLYIWDTTGKWPLGHGNNPAITGQSILEGKFDNTDTGNSNNLFIDLNIPDVQKNKH